MTINCNKGGTACRCLQMYASLAMKIARGVFYDLQDCLPAGGRKGEAVGMIIMRKLEKLRQTCFEGEITMPKTIFWLIGVICLLAGTVYGLLAAPLTHGVTIGSNNGNYNSCIWNEDEEDEEA